MRARPTAALLVAAVLAAVSACSDSEPDAAPAPAPSAAQSSSPATAPPPTVTPTQVRDVDPAAVQVLTTGLEAPWGIDFLPDGDALVTERDTARVLRVPAAGGAPVEVLRMPGVVPGGEGGLMGIAVSPTFADDGLVYAYFTAAQDNRIVRFRIDGDPRVEPIVTGIPKSSNHNGGRIAFAPDGTLYAGTGDAGERARSQDDSSLGGKVLRMTPDGEPVAPATSLVFSKGHRNVQGLAFDDAGRLYAVEFGQNRFDEVNQVVLGSNGGWPEVEGPGDGGGRFLAPIVTWSTDEASPSGAAIVGDTLWVAALRGRRLWQVPLDGRGGAGTPQAVLAGQFGRLRAAHQAPDGSLWVLTSNRDGRGDPTREDDRILRLPPA